MMNVLAYADWPFLGCALGYFFIFWSYLLDPSAIEMYTNIYYVISEKNLFA